MSSQEGNPKAIQALLEGNGSILSRDQTSETSMFLVKWIDGTTGETSRAKVPEGELRTSCSKQLDQCFLNERKTQQERSIRSKRPELLRIEQIHDIKHHGEYLIGSLVTHCWFCCQKNKVNDAETTTTTLADSDSRASGDAALEPQRLIGIWIFGWHGAITEGVAASPC
ncbi:hypothetical protein BKA60DRAFT_541499 [Fusarium oxysporum]|nr:hypothetical protein BKA60DRAFT_541499 [Fusarium oxysporum]